MHLLHRRLLVAALVLTALVAVGTRRDASAQVWSGTPQQKAGLLTTQGRPLAVNLNAPPKPALPAKCAEPTLAECTTKATYDKGCFVEATKKQAMLDFCTWVIRSEWYKANVAGVTTLFPTSAPNSPSPILTPPRKIDRGKNFPAGNQTISPAGRRRFAGTTPPPPPGGVVRGTAPGGGAVVGTAPPRMNWSPTRVQSSNGSYTSTNLATMMNNINLAAQEMEFFAAPGAKASDPLLLGKVGTFEAIYNQIPPFAPTPGPRVTSCMEYAYKRWGDYAKFSRFAKALGRNHRAISAIAFDPNIGINKELKQTGVSDKTPKQTIEKLSGSHWQHPYHPDPALGGPWYHDIFLPLNAFQSVKPSWLRKPGMPITADQITRVDAGINPRFITANGSDTPRTIRAKTDTSPLGLHREAKARFDSVYGNPSDDELADATKRKHVYQTRLVERLNILQELVCTDPSDPCFECRARPSPPQPSGTTFTKGVQLAPSLQKVIEKVKGLPVSYPSDIFAELQTGNAVRDQKSLIFIEQISTQAMSDLETAAGVRVNGKLGGPGAAGGGLRKEKALPEFAQVKPANPSAPFNTQCMNQLAARRNQLNSALENTEKMLTRLLVNELSYGARGCLADPGLNNVNLCDWSYELMASEVSTLFDEEMENDLRECAGEIQSANQAAATTGFEPVTKNANKQKLVFPCVWRQDFAANAPLMKKFMELNGNMFARYCEVEHQNTQVALQQAGIANDIRGMKWKPADGELYDDALDALTLGEPSVLGAFFDYSTNWKLKRTYMKPEAGPMGACKFDGSAKSKVSAGIDFFGEKLELALLDGNGAATGNTTSGSVIFQYLDFQSRSFKRPGQLNTSWNTQTFAPSPEPFINLGGGEVDFWFTIGPVPIHIIFGAVATAGVGYKFTGKSGDNCANFNNPTGFNVQSEISPFARADAYADASIDVVVVSAGVRLDLLLLRLGVPLGVNVQNTSGTNWRFLNGGKITIDMLSGRMTGYVEVGVAPLEESFEATIFSWDGFHFDVGTWGLDRQITGNVIRIATAGTVTTENVQCACPVTTTSDNNYCCSKIPCPDGAPNCSARKKVDGQWQQCAFRREEYDAIVKRNGTTMPFECRQFIKPYP